MSWSTTDLITLDEFRDFVFTWPVEFWAGTNPDFFKGTSVESATQRLLGRIVNGEVPAAARV